MEKVRPKVKSSKDVDDQLTSIMLKWPVSPDQLLDDRNVLSYCC